MQSRLYGILRIIIDVLLLQREACLADLNTSLKSNHANVNSRTQLMLTVVSLKAEMAHIPNLHLKHSHSTTYKIKGYFMSQALYC